MEIIFDFMRVAIGLFFLVLSDFGYWVDGVRIDFYASEQYKQEAVALMDADALSVAEYENKTGQLYTERDFSGLTTIIEASQAATEAGAIPLALWDDMLVFHVDGLDSLELLNGWIEDDPDNWIAYAARAEYYRRVGWRSRGNAYRSSTSEEQFAGMYVAFAAAKRDLEKALSLRPQYSGAYRSLLNIAKASSGKKKQREIVDRAIEQGIGEYYLFSEYLLVLAPKWGGSVAKMRNFAINAQNAREEDPRVYQLLGFEYRIQAQAASSDKEWQACVDHYTKAFEYGDLWSWRYGRATCNEKLEHWDDAISDLEKVGVETEDDRAFSRSARAHANMKRYSKALVSIETAIELEPDHIAHTNYAGWLHTVMGNTDLALEAYALTASTLPNDVYAAENSGRIYLDRDDRAAALPFLKISANYDEENAYKWFLYADVLNHLENPEYLAALERFLEKVDRKDSRWGRRIEMAEAHLDGRGEFKHMIKMKR